jgi:WhiB family transcriptional regulator, redox-sensing transcriptional regulator
VLGSGQSTGLGLGPDPRTFEVRMHATSHSHATSASWAAQGACRHADPELFFPVSSAGPAASQVARAKLICTHCPVRPECLEFALDSGQDFGVWGGASEGERRTMRRRRMRQRRAIARRTAS